MQIQLRRYRGLLMSFENIKLTPLIILIILNAVSLGIDMAKSGETREYSFLSSFIGTIIEWGLILWLIW